MAEPYHTNEVRWFFAGAMPFIITDWFLGLLPGDSMDSPAIAREDLYLIAAGRDDAGLKFRRDRIQLKLRGKTRPLSAQQGRVAGRAGAWIRYSWTYDKQAGDLAAAFLLQCGEGLRIAVAKRRRQLRYDLGPQGRARALLPGESLATPLLIEITEVDFADFSGWSLGLDAVGPGPAAADRLGAAVEAVLGDFPLLPLKRQNSFSYPEFLARHLTAPA